MRFQQHAPLLAGAGLLGLLLALPAPSEEQDRKKSNPNPMIGQVETEEPPLIIPRPSKETAAPKAEADPAIRQAGFEEPPTIIPRPSKKTAAPKNDADLDEPPPIIPRASKKPVAKTGADLDEPPPILPRPSKKPDAKTDADLDEPPPIVPRSAKNPAAPDLDEPPPIIPRSAKEPAVPKVDADPAIRQAGLEGPPPANPRAAREPAAPKADAKPIIRQVDVEEPAPKKPPAREPAVPKADAESGKLPPPLPAPASNKLPIDLVTAFRLANAQNPTIAIAWARVREAAARQDQADVLWLPNLTAGGSYLRHDGQTQNQQGEVFGVSRSNVFGGGGAQLRVDTSEALFTPLVARRLVQAEAAAARASVTFTQLDVALAYLDLVYAYGLLAVNADTLAKAEKTFELARAAAKAGVSKTAGDINRARTDVALRRQERIELEAQASVASARLTRLLLLQPGAELVPADPIITPVTLIDPDLSLDDLIGLALRNRPDLAANRAAALAAWERLRQARYAPLVPKLQVDYLAGTFGGGRNDFIGNFSGRGDLMAQAYWEFRNFGFGNAAQIRERRAQQDQAALRVVDLQAQVAAEVNQALKITTARQRALDEAQEAVREGSELYRKLLAIQFSPLGDNRRYDPLELQLAVQSLNQARVQYLLQVVDYNRTQFRLYASIGSPAECALPRALRQKLEVPVAPPAETPKAEMKPK